MNSGHDLCYSNYNINPLSAAICLYGGLLDMFFVFLLLSDLWLNYLLPLGYHHYHQEALFHEFLSCL